jgi:excisionase family DNA binding protein
LKEHDEQKPLKPKGENQLKKLLTEAELSEFLNISKSTLHKLREEGDIPFQLIGTCIRYHIDDVEKWLKTNSHNEPTERKVEE